MSSSNNLSTWQPIFGNPEPSSQNGSDSSENRLPSWQVAFRVSRQILWTWACGAVKFKQLGNLTGHFRVARQVLWTWACGAVKFKYLGNLTGCVETTPQVLRTWVCGDVGHVKTQFERVTWQSLIRKSMVKINLSCSQSQVLELVNLSTWPFDSLPGA